MEKASEQLFVLMDNLLTETNWFFMRKIIDT
jgi:hypothetical protein